MPPHCTAAGKIYLVFDSEGALNQSLPDRLQGFTGKTIVDKRFLNEQVKEISEPFKSRYGWHIVQMLGTRTYDSTDDVRRQRAFAAIRESKADEETELWLRRLRDEAFVEIKM